MINRSATVTSIALILMMIAATLWRLPMLPDWAYGPNGAPPPARNPLVMFVLPACVAVVGGMLALKKWLTTATADAVEPWKRWGSHLLVGYGVIVTLLHLYFIARSAGFAAPFGPTAVARAIIVLCCSVIIVVANQIPKLPWLPSRFRIGHLDPVRGARLLRFGGRLLVLSGLANIVAALLMPLRMLAPLVFSTVAALLLAVAVHKIQLHREQSQERLNAGS